ncbi:carbohydrate ABC transporter permease [Alkalibacterium olivapovliticus]|uniref:Putative aldouronate transport system permease protein n=1 Tax=Alkalibacterium olivapovliticus TaxID=99907 RepID=A0A2T0W5D3_9LACT|nr:carbohydrate ABC transporter permease [Alkalibacterium olivapovliticus]PRY80992.1 putative aldouronate transport system permease protein [Alkalibacterium olivapovliticus]
METTIINSQGKTVNSKIRKKWSERPTKTDVFIGLFMMIVIVLTLYPFLHVLAISLNNAVDTARGGLTIFPRDFTLQNYREIFSGNNNWIIAFRNSVLRTVIGTITATFSCAVLAYILSRKNYILRRPLGIILVLTMYVSGGLVPTYLIIRNVGLMNSFMVYIIPALLNAFNVIVIRSFIDGLPEALEESAKIDGANDITIFLKIIMPLCMPVLATVALFTAVGQWNNWFDTYLYAGSNVNLTTLQYELMQILGNAQSMTSSQVHQLNQAEGTIIRTTPESIKMAATIIVTVPIVIVYPFLQKYFVSGLTLGAVKS